MTSWPSGWRKIPSRDIDRDSSKRASAKRLLLGIEADVDREVDEATEEAKAGEIPGEDLLMKDVWADGR